VAWSNIVSIKSGLNTQVQSIGEAKGMRNIVLFGSNLVVSTVGASLRGRSGLQLIQIDALAPDALQRLEAACPDVILFDLAAARSDFAVPLLRNRPCLLLVGVDLVTKKMLLLSGEESHLFTTEDLLEVISGDIENEGA